MAGRWTVPHGVTRISVDASGVAGKEMVPVYERFDNSGDSLGFNYGGKGGYGYGCRRRYRSPLARRSYVGVASDSGTNLIPGGDGMTNAGKGGAASWISDMPRAGGGCVLRDTQAPGEDLVPGRSHPLLRGRRRWRWRGTGQQAERQRRRRRD